jgi:hypothetical protein
MLSSSASPLPIIPDHVAWCDTLADLAVLREPAITMAIHRREPDATIAAFLNQRSVLEFCCLRTEIWAQAAEAALADEMDRQGLAASFGRRAWIADLSRLIATFCQISGTSRALLRIERVTTDACWLFHPDHFPARMVCTYRGPATQWLPEDSADRCGIGQGDNDRICRDWSRVQTLQPFWVGLMKGETWPGHTGGGLLHRSPPLKSGEWRMFVALDPA